MDLLVYFFQIKRNEIDVDVILSPLSNSKVLLGKTSAQARYYAKTLKELFEK